MSKIRTLDEALSTVEDGSQLGLCGFAISRNAVAAATELIRQGKRNLRLVQVVGGMETDLLVAAGCASELVYSGGSLDRFGPLHSVNRAIASGQLAVHEYSTLSLSLRLFAGGLDLPFVGTRTLLGSQLLEALVDAGGAVVMKDPFTGSPAVGLAPMRPDVALLHANTCDDEGNAVVNGPTWSIRETALAAGRTIVTAERVVPAGTIDPATVTLPGLSVAAVVEAPSGARPTAVFGEYDFDAGFFEEHVAASKQGGEAFEGYLKQRLLSTLP